MLKTKFLISLLLTITILVAQVGTVFAAPAKQGPALIAGTVQSITLETDINTGITTVLVTMLDQNGLSKTARVSLETAITLGLVTLDGDGKPVINTSALGQSIEVDPANVILAEGADQHPIGSALAAFFSGINGLTYNQIMAAHDKGTGFGVIAQALWLTMELGGNSEDFQALLLAKENGDYKDYAIVDEEGTITTPKSWGQLRKAILDGKKVTNLGIVRSNQDNNGNGNIKDKDKDKNKDKNNKGNGNRNRNGNGNNK
jgi:hypothetical protein